MTTFVLQPEFAVVDLLPRAPVASLGGELPVASALPVRRLCPMQEIER